MPDIKFRCPKCSRSILVDADSGEKVGQCPYCENLIEILIPMSVQNQSSRFSPANFPPPILSSTPIRTTSDLAVWSLVLGIISFIASCFLLGIPAIICGHFARKRIKNANGGLSGEGMALAGLILGYFSFFLSLILYVFVKGLSEKTSIETTKSSIMMLDSSISAYTMMHGGKLPNTLKDTSSIIDLKDYYKDGFGADIIYIPNHSEKTYKIVSLGSDGKFGTSDDITNNDTPKLLPNLTLPPIPSHY